MAKANETSTALDQYVLVHGEASEGTHLFDEVELSLAGVVRRFGPGGEGDGYKVSRCWVFRKADLVFTLYDWKATHLYDVEMWCPDELWASEWPFDLHVGSKAPATEADVSEFVAYLQRTIDPHTPDPVYSGPLPKKLRDDCGCECGVFYENQITMPKRHSLICFCPKCGCVTQD